MEDVDIYADLPSIHLEDAESVDDDNEFIEKLAKFESENSRLLEKLQQLEDDHNKCDTLKTNFSSLLKTARLEIQRKDSQIAELRDKLNSLTFRRNQRNNYNLRNRNPGANFNGQMTNSQHYSAPVNEEYQDDIKASDQKHQLEYDQNVQSDNVYYPPDTVKHKRKSHDSDDDDDFGSDNKQVDKDAYKFTLYGQRLHKRNDEEAKEKKRKEEEAAIERMKMANEEAENEKKNKKIEIEAIKKEENKCEPKTMDSVTTEVKTKTEVGNNKRETEIQRSMKRVDEFERSTAKENAMTNGKTDFVDNVNTAYKGNHLQSKDGDYKSSESMKQRDLKQRDSINNYKHNNPRNLEHSSKSNKFKDPREYSRSSDRYRSRYRERSKSPDRRRGRSSQNKSRHRGRSNSIDRMRDARSQRAHYKERSISCDRVKVGLSYHKVRHKDRSNSPDRNKENFINHKSRVYNNSSNNNSRDSRNSDRCKEDKARSHVQSKDDNISSSKAKTNENDKERSSSENKEKNEKPFSQFRIPKLKNRSTSGEKSPERSRKRKADSRDVVKDKPRENVAKNKLESIPEKRRRIDNDDKIQSREKHEREKTSGKDDSKNTKMVEKIEKVKNKIESANVVEKVPTSIPCIQPVEKVATEITNIETNLAATEELEDGEISDSPSFSPHPTRTDYAIRYSRMKDVIDTQMDTENLAKNVTEKEVSSKQKVGDQNIVLVKNDTQQKMIQGNVMETIVKTDNKAESSILHSILTANDAQHSKNKKSDSQKNVQNKIEVKINLQKVNTDKITNKVMPNEKEVGNVKNQDTLLKMEQNYNFENTAAFDTKETITDKNESMAKKQESTLKDVLPRDIIHKGSNKNNTKADCESQKVIVGAKEKDLKLQVKRTKRVCKEKEKTTNEVSKVAKDKKSPKKQTELNGYCTKTQENTVTKVLQGEKIKELQAIKTVVADGSDAQEKIVNIDLSKQKIAKLESTLIELQNVAKTIESSNKTSYAESENTENIPKTPCAEPLVESEISKSKIAGASDSVKRRKITKRPVPKDAVIIKVNPIARRRRTVILSDG